MNDQSTNEKKRAVIAMAVNTYIQSWEAAAVASATTCMPAPQPVMMAPQVWVVPAQSNAAIAAVSAVVKHLGSETQ